MLAAALIEGETSAPRPGANPTRASRRSTSWWRRSGGTLPRRVSETRCAQRLRAQLEPVDSWEDFLRTRIARSGGAGGRTRTRARLDALPAMIRVRGDAAPLDYEVADGEGVARVRLREGQAKRLRAGELPPLDRPLRFAVRAAAAIRPCWRTR